MLCSGYSISLSKITADKRCSSHVTDRLTETQVSLSVQKFPIRSLTVLSDRESLFVVHCHYQAVLTTKVPLSLCGLGQRSRSFQPGEIKEESGLSELPAARLSSALIGPLWTRLGTCFSRDPHRKGPKNVFYRH